MSVHWALSVLALELVVIASVRNQPMTCLGTAVSTALVMFLIYRAATREPGGGASKRWHKMGKPAAEVASVQEIVLRKHPPEAAGRLISETEPLPLARLVEEISRNPGRAALYIQRGKIYSENRQLDLAVQDYDHAIEIDRNLGEAYQLRGLVHLELGRLTEAIENLLEAQRLDPQSAVIQGYLRRAQKRLLSLFNEKQTTSLWEVIFPRGRMQFTSFTNFASAVAAGAVSKDTPVRRIRYDQVEKALPSFANVSESPGKLPFELHILFLPPIWAHTKRGALYGAALGAGGNLCLTVVNLYQVNPIAGSFAALLIVWIAVSMLPPGIREPIKGLTRRLPLLVPVLVWLSIFQPLVVKYGFLEFWKGLGVGLQAPFFAACVGALLVVFPAMIVGTLVGGVRKHTLKRSPTGAADVPLVWIKGLAGPLFAFVFVVVAYIWFVRWTAG